MADNPQREHYIPVRRADLVRLLADDPALGPARAAIFRRWSELLSATLHFEYKRLHEKLKDAYAPFDPESTTVAVDPPDAEERQAQMDELFTRFERLLTRANFRPLDAEAIEEATKQHSDRGIDMQVDFSVFERFQLHVRGDDVGTTCRRRWYRLWREEKIPVPLYRRLVLIVKLARGGRFPAGIDTDDVFVKYFKDIPQADIEMLLPGARLIMPGVLRLKMGGSILSGLFILSLNIVKPLLTTAILGVQYLYGLLFGLLGYGWRQYSGYQSTRAAINLRLTESLYFQSMANNSSVFASLLDEAEEQDTREAILAYHYLWRHAGPHGATMAEIDAAVEQDLEQRLRTPVDFEVDDALAKLERLKLVTRRGDRFVAVPIQTALEILDRRWDNQFQYASAA